MEPTLNINDRVLVIKDKFLNLNYKIGDVIVFYNPDYVYQKNTFEEFYDSLQIWNFNNQQLTIDTAFIKRVVGFEGDEIKIKDGDIYNNGTLIKFVNIPVNETKVDVTYIVPSNSIFVLGDNRSNSIDSRIYGSININQIIGRAEYKIYPINEISNIND